MESNRSNHAVSPHTGVGRHAHLTLRGSEELWSPDQMHGCSVTDSNLSAPSMVTDNVYDIVQKDVSSSIALSLPGFLLQHAKEPWLKLASTLVSSCTLNHKY